MSIAYHAKLDGQIEVQNRMLEMYLWCFSLEQPKIWAKFILWAEYWYNTSYHGVAKCTPFEVVYGRAPPSLARFIPGEILVDAIA